MDKSMYRTIQTKDITSTTYTELKHAYDFFNRELFKGKLPPCMITLNRKANTYGYFVQLRL